jgi:hypothetical protein
VKVRDLVIAVSAGVAVLLIARYLITQAFGDFPFCKLGGTCPRLAPSWTDLVSTLGGFIAGLVTIAIRRRWRR